MARPALLRVCLLRSTDHVVTPWRTYWVYPISLRHHEGASSPWITTSTSAIGLSTITKRFNIPFSHFIRIGGKALKPRCFFLQLPFGHHGPVSELSVSNMFKLCCTGPFNWGEALCAGEKVKQGRTITRKSHKTQNNKQQEPGRSPPRQPGTPRPGSQLHEPRKEKQPHETS